MTKGIQNKQFDQPLYATRPESNRLMQLRLQWQTDTADGETQLPFDEYARTYALRSPYDQTFQTVKDEHFDRNVKPIHAE